MMARISVPVEAISVAKDVLSSGAMGLSLPASLHSVDAALQRKQNVVLYGPPGTGKTHAAFVIADAWQASFGEGSVFRTTFHPSYSYEDFVHGFRPRTSDPSTYTLQDGIFLRACDRAWEFTVHHQRGTPRRPVLLLIDEVNRADVARVFGELITFIESDKRSVVFNFAQMPSRSYAIPDNLYILGTMNTADKSVSLLDVALRRRFAFVSFEPDSSTYSTVDEWLPSVDELDVGRVLEFLNNRLLSLGIESDRAIGHALLAVPAQSLQPKEVLRELLSNDVVPLLQEYFYMDRERVRQVLGELVDEHGRFDDRLTAEHVYEVLRGMVATASHRDESPESNVVDVAYAAEEGGQYLAGAQVGVGTDDAAASLEEVDDDIQS